MKEIILKNDSWHSQIVRAYGMYKPYEISLIEYIARFLAGFFMIATLVILGAAILYPWVDLLMALSVSSAPIHWHYLVIEAAVMYVFYYIYVFASLDDGKTPEHLQKIGNMFPNRFKEANIKFASKKIIWDILKDNDE